MLAYKGELEKTVTFKDKARQHPENINAGLLTYPVLQTADIIMHRASHVPVGKDQEQHLEMARTFGNRFNRIYNNDLFPEPQAFNYGNQLVKVPGLQGGGKMSKSDGDNTVINLNDDDVTIRKKIMKAVSDITPTEPNSTPSQAVQNLFELMELVSTNDVIEHYKNTFANCSIRYGDMKKQLAEDMAAFILPIKQKIDDLKENDEMLGKIAKTGAEKAKESASKTINEARKMIGFTKFY
jgi:tryptophanyl-tRNA synthetase